MAVSFSADESVGVVTLDKPPANSYDLAFIEELAASVEAAAGDEDVKVVVVRSASERFFCAGADVKAFNENSIEANMEMIRASHETLASIATIPKVFIAEINAHALGGGLEIALACDLRFAAEGDYRIGTPEVTPDAYWHVGGRAISKLDFLYLSTPTRLSGLLLGAAFAMVWRPAALLRGP